MGPILCCVSVRLMITAVKAKTLFHIIKNIKQIGQIKVLFPEIQIKGLPLRIIYSLSLVRVIVHIPIKLALCFKYRYGTFIDVGIMVDLDFVPD